MADPILEVISLTKCFGAIAASDGLTFSVKRGTIHGLIGPNGAGKSTAIAQLSGELQSDTGRVRFDGQDVTRWAVDKRARSGLQRSYQITSLLPEFTAEDNVAMAIQSQQGHSFRFWENARKDNSLRTPSRKILERVGLSDFADNPAMDLAHGQQRQLELAMVLATAPSMLLLDEPMAGMGQSESLRMMELLRPLKGDVTMLLVEHDMDVVFALADMITVLVKGQVLLTGTPDEIKNHPEVRRAYLGDY
ncbi:branched-chain amino acid ABC transporter substrate-binding protein [Kiloniella spongiae]|uniref:Branched-chain amino acid ABC transporter substrate-binding protein n=1 Tax=Kiloniella spongiae TaxID=1489064 RepID=A0A0H2MUP5_9PROT|nr:ABC transporter ATP-binding protein [Kiloniella spongiae]KLN60400.1 branched-chain amino acid ABC transporter substrate-binding protein [Kiloniella spongiae]